MSKPKENPIVVDPRIRREPMLVPVRITPTNWTPDAPIKLVDGRLTTISQLANGKNLVLHFFYTRCNGTCPATTENIKKIVRMMPGRFTTDSIILSISLDPEHDSLADIKGFSAAHSLPREWLLGKVEREDLDILLNTIGFNAEKSDKKTRAIAHASEVVFGNQRSGRWRTANPQWSTPATVKQNFEITFDGLAYKNPRNPGIRLDTSLRRPF